MPARVGAVFALVLALLFAQTLGLLHGVVHGHRAAAIVGGPVAAQDIGAVASRAAHAPRDAAGAHDFFSTLFAGHQHDGDCRVYDQLSHGDLLAGMPAAVLPLALVPFVFSLLPGLATARWHALFQARGPPPVR